MPKPPPFRPMNQLSHLKPPPGGVILRPEAAEENRIAEENNRAQATLNELAAIHQDENDLVDGMISAAITADGAVGLDPATVARIEELAKEINERRQRKKWLNVAALLADLGIKETGKGQRHMVWAAKRFGVELTPPAPTVLVPDPPEELGADNTPKPE